MTFVKLFQINQSTEKGKHWKKNQRKRQKKLAKKAIESETVSVISTII